MKRPKEELNYKLNSRIKNIDKVLIFLELN